MVANATATFTKINKKICLREFGLAVGRRSASREQNSWTPSGHVEADPTREPRLPSF